MSFKKIPLYAIFKHNQLNKDKKVPASQNQYYTYIIASQKNGTLYIGMTNDLIRRIYEHKNNLNKGFASKYSTHQLVWYEAHSTATAAITREKQIKKWKRAWKIRLIEKENPNWNDLYDDLTKFI